MNMQLSNEIVLDTPTGDATTPYLHQNLMVRTRHETRTLSAAD